MNAKRCKILRRNIKDMNLPISTIKMSYAVNLWGEGLIFVFKHEERSARRIYQDIKHGRA